MAKTVDGPGEHAAGVISTQRPQPIGQMPTGPISILPLPCDFPFQGAELQGIVRQSSAESSLNMALGEDRFGHSVPEPRYAAIKNYVLDEISRGVLRPGDRIESEAELIKHFGVSRMTAHRALRELQDAGVVVRMPGLGTFVADTSAKGHIIEIRNIADEIRARGHQHSASVIVNKSQKADRKAGALLEVPSGTPIYHSIIVHREANVPIQLEERFVLAEAAPGYHQADFSRITPNEYLMRAAPLERVDHKVRAVLPDSTTQELLHVKEGEPCLLLIRRTWSQSRMVSYALLTHPGNRFEFDDSFTVG